MNRFVLKNTFIKVYIYHFSINIFIEKYAYIFIDCVAVLNDLLVRRSIRKRPLSLTSRTSLPSMTRVQLDQSPTHSPHLCLCSSSKNLTTPTAHHGGSPAPAAADHAPAPDQLGGTICSRICRPIAPLFFPFLGRLVEAGLCVRVRIFLDRRFGFAFRGLVCSSRG